MNSELAVDLAGTALAMARRFHTGATLWCAAAAMEPHARHLADEFAHPAPGDGPALPAFTLAVPRPAAPRPVSPRPAAPSPPVPWSRVRPGDIVAVVAAADEEPVAGLMRHATIEGARSIWIGAGPKPPAGAADHVLWIDDLDALAPMADWFVPLCRLLRELTHVCFAHPRLLPAPPRRVPAPARQVFVPARHVRVPAQPERPSPVLPAHVPGSRPAGDYCVTCGDEGRLGEVVTPPDGPFAPALVRTAAGEEPVDVSLVTPVGPGDLILIHAGTALARPARPACSVPPHGSHADDRFT